MATRAASNPIDVQKLVSGAAKLELKLLNAGVEALQVYINQAARLSSLASDTLQAIQDDKATLADTAHKLTAFGRQYVQDYASLSQRLGASYYAELDRLADSVLKSGTDKDGTSAATGTDSTTTPKGKARRAAQAVAKPTGRARRKAASA
jgi:hypothetical protein